MVLPNCAGFDSVGRICILSFQGSLNRGRPGKGSMKRLLLLLTALMMCLQHAPVLASDFGKLSRAAFKRSSTDLDEIEAEEGARAAAAEIAVARKWIEDGRLFLREGRMKKAAVLAEKLPAQIELIRVIVAAGLVAAEATGVEKEILLKKKTLIELKARLDRLMLQRRGVDARSAEPSAKGAKP